MQIKKREVGAVGRIEAHPTLTPPKNTIKANGATLLRSAFWRLWEYAQKSGNLVPQAEKQAGNFGDGDGLNTFTTPDLRAVFLRGVDDGLGKDAGRVIGGFQDFSIENITAGVGTSIASSAGIFSGPSGAFGVGSYDGDCADKLSGYGGYRRLDFNAARVVKTSTETRPMNAALLYCIRYQ